MTKEYSCATCGTSDPDRYVSCWHPLCPDGHDQPYPDRDQRGHQASSGSAWRVLAIALVSLIAIALTLSVALSEEVHLSARILWSWT